MNRIDWTAFGQQVSGMLGNNQATDDVMNPECPPSHDFRSFHQLPLSASDVRRTVGWRVEPSGHSSLMAREFPQRKCGAAGRNRDRIINSPNPFSPRSPQWRTGLFFAFPMNTTPRPTTLLQDLGSLPGQYWIPIETITDENGNYVAAQSPRRGLQQEGESWQFSTLFGSQKHQSCRTVLRSWRLGVEFLKLSAWGTEMN
jgi:hypothetical protein